METEWRRIHLHTMQALSLVIIAVEVLMTFVLESSGLARMAVTDIVVWYLLIPIFVYAVVNLTAWALLRLPGISGKTGNYIISLSFTALIIAVCFFHDYFVVVYACGVTAILLTTIYSDRILTGITTAVLILSSLLLSSTAHWDPSVVRDETYVIDVGLIAVIELSTYFISVKVISWEEGRRHAVVIRQYEVECLRRTAEADQLTCIRNRRGLRRYIDERKQPLVYAMMDIDYFKIVNDRWGHEAGDQVLRSLGKLLRAAESDSAAAFRYGGDEFLLVFSGRTVQEAHAFCEGMRRKFAETLPPDMLKAKVSLSYGLSPEGKELEPSEAIRAADCELYRSKHSV